jgi:hypothetical protein
MKSSKERLHELSPHIPPKPVEREHKHIDGRNEMLLYADITVYLLAISMLNNMYIRHMIYICLRVSPMSRGAKTKWNPYIVYSCVNGYVLYFAG